MAQTSGPETMKHPPPPILEPLTPEMRLLQETAKLLSRKIAILEQMKTIPLLDQLNAQMTELEKQLHDELDYKNKNRGLIASAGDDCSLVKARLAELWTDSPPLNAAGKPATQADKEAWLRGQRTADNTLKEIIVQQQKVLGAIESFRIEQESIKRKLEATLAVIRLKTAQIEFLGGK